MQIRKLVAEALGTAVLVFVGVGVATLSFGFKLAGVSTSAGVVATALAFGLVLLALAYTLGPISAAHVNPAVTLGFLVSKRITRDRRDRLLGRPIRRRLRRRGAAMGDRVRIPGVQQGAGRPWAPTAGARTCR